MTRRAFRDAALVGLAALALTGCNREEERAPPPPADDRPVPKARVVPTADGESDIYEGVTPMAERVAVVSLLNKRNGLVRDVTLRPGESIRLGRAVIRLRACERSAQWESPREVGAFVQLLVLEYQTNQWRRVHSGWLFRNRPERNIIQHPIYDVFVRSCTMTWPGEAPVEDDPDAAPAPGNASAAQPSSQPSRAPQSPAPRAAPAAAPEPAPAAPAAEEPDAAEPATEEEE